MIRRPPRSTLSSSSAASDVYKRQAWNYTECSSVPSNDMTQTLAGSQRSCDSNHKPSMEGQLQLTHQQQKQGWAKFSTRGPHGTSLRSLDIRRRTHFIKQQKLFSQTKIYYFVYKESNKMATESHHSLVKHNHLATFVWECPRLHKLTELCKMTAGHIKGLAGHIHEMKPPGWQN